MTDLDEAVVPEQLGADLNRCLELLNTVDLHAGDSDDRNKLALLLAQAGQVRKAASEVYQAVENALMSVAGEPTFEVPNLGVVEVKKKKKRTRWDNEGLWTAVVRRARDQGEEPLVVLERCARPTWRVVPLRDLGLQIDEWCEETDDGYSIKLPSQGLTEHLEEKW